MPPKCERCNKPWWECTCEDDDAKLDDSQETEDDYCKKCGNQWAECSCEEDLCDFDDEDDNLDDEKIWDEDEEDFE
jgi:hypothetical protein